MLQASKVDDSVVWGWPFVLTPIMDLGTSLGNMGAAERRLAAIIQVSHCNLSMAEHKRT